MDSFRPEIKGVGAITRKEVNRKRINWFANYQRGKKFAKVPTLSDDEKAKAIAEFLAQGKGKKYPQGATGDPHFKDDEKCIALLNQVTVLSYKGK
jgi:hypothetical protein